MNKFERARQKFKPKQIKILLIGETPPKKGSERFFYFPNVKTQDSLFIETIRAFYPELTQGFKTKQLRPQKKMFLIRLKKDGKYLIDSLDTPFEGETIKHKITLLENGQKKLLKKIKKLIDENTKIVLISKNVFSANYLFLKSNGINIINTEYIEFPIYRGRELYRRKLSEVHI